KGWLWRRTYKVNAHRHTADGTVGSGSGGGPLSAAMHVVAERPHRQDLHGGGGAFLVDLGEGDWRGDGVCHGGREIGNVLLDVGIGVLHGDGHPVIAPQPGCRYGSHDTHDAPPKVHQGAAAIAGVGNGVVEHEVLVGFLGHRNNGPPGELHTIAI